MKRPVLFIGLLLCMLAGVGIASASYDVGTSKSLPSVAVKGSNVPDPRFYGGKITALRPGAVLDDGPRTAGDANPKSKIQNPKSPLALPTFGTDVNISSGNETFMAANPANPLNFVSGANISGRFTTTDGGVTWSVGSLSSGGDPAGAFDSQGRAYFAALGNTSSCPDNPYLYKSTNGGLNWTGPTMPLTDPSPSDHFFDKEWITVDNNASSPFLGRIYYTASDFHTPPGCNLNAYIDVAEKLVWSSDAGVTWSQPVNINDAPHNQDQFTNPVAAPNGTLYVSYQYQNCTFNCTRDLPMSNMIAKSTDGGLTFSPSITITGQVISPTGAFSGGYQYLYASSTASGFRHNDQAIIGVAPNNSSQVYALWTDGRWDSTFVYQGITGSHADIAFSRSTDGGNTWTAPIRVNNDTLGNGKDQFFPWMTVGSDGAIHASWMDRRDSSTGFQYGEYYSQSTDAGLTWSANIQVADVLGTPGSFIGDYSGLAVNGDNTLVLPIWTDSRSGQRAYTDRGVMQGGPTATPTPTLTPCAACTNTPTPVNTATRTITPTSTPTTCAANYICSTSPGATIVPGTVDSGNHGDDTVTQLDLPFPFTLYSTPYTSVNISSNGNMQFATVNNGFTNNCLPDQTMGPAIFPFWDDLLTDGTGCAGGCGIFTSISGNAPNRIFNIEWRATYFTGAGTANFEIRLYEGTNHFDVIEGDLSNNGSATVGVQDGATRFTQCDCSGGGIPSNTLINFTLGQCGTPTSTPTPTQVLPTVCPTTAPTDTFTPGATNTATATGTPCSIAFSDVNPPDYFYTSVMYLACHGAVSGYADGTFRPYNNMTRGQVCKVVVLALNMTINTEGGPHFSDVPITHPFYQYIETLYNSGAISGYADGTFRPQNNVTRAQLVKIVCLAMGWPPSDPPTATYNDVPRGSPFYGYIETAACSGIITGYSDGTFRPYNYVTRGQAAKVIYGAINGAQPCPTPTATVMVGR